MYPITIISFPSCGCSSLRFGTIAPRVGLSAGRGIKRRDGLHTALDDYLALVNRYAVGTDAVDVVELLPPELAALEVDSVDVALPT